jgi:hypothetical protein
VCRGIPAVWMAQPGFAVRAPRLTGCQQHVLHGFVACQGARGDFTVQLTMSCNRQDGSSEGEGGRFKGRCQDGGCHADVCGLQVEAVVARVCSSLVQMSLCTCSVPELKQRPWLQRGKPLVPGIRSVPTCAAECKYVCVLTCVLSTC